MAARQGVRHDQRAEVGSSQAATPSTPAATADRILDVAEELAQTRGYNGFSYADVAAEVGIRKASLHYHFATKADLGVALIDRYGRRFLSALATIEQEEATTKARLDALVEVYRQVLQAHRMCLCGMLAADFDTLPVPMRAHVVAFFDRAEAWVADVLRAGVEHGEVRLLGSADETAQALVGGLEGAMLVARPFEDALERFDASARRLVDGLIAAG